VIYGVSEGLKDRFEVPPYFRCRNSENAVARGSQIFIPDLIVFPLIRLVMDLSVDLDDQPDGFTGEIRKVAPDRMLAAKLQAVQASVAQAGPYPFLRRRRRFSELAGQV
jgi:hypothetical protein